MTHNTKNRRIVVGMSGGVDSSVAAALLLRQGHNVIGITMKTYAFDEVGGNPGNETSCCGMDAFNDARMVAVQLGIPHYVVDFTEQFGTQVIDNFVQEYLRGRTPNPCIICNKKIKWGELLAKASSLGAQKIATGHYARIVYDEVTGRYAVKRSVYREKDQSYALWGLSQEALSRTVFPLGEFAKADVREIAAAAGLKTAAKQESFEICFIPDDNYGRFLQERIPGLESHIGEGDILRDGEKVGSHKGYPFYTIGQRGGIGAHGERMYVTGIEAETNTISIGKDSALLHRRLIAKDVNLQAYDRLPAKVRMTAQVRYKDADTSVVVTNLDDGRIEVVFDEPKRAITPGQSVVLYHGELLIGGGVIDEVID